MPRGISKMAVHIKDTGNPYFEEAIFILKAGTDGLSGTDVASEAQKIVDNYTKRYCRNIKSNKKTKKLIFLTCGFCAVVMTLLFLWYYFG